MAPYTPVATSKTGRMPPAFVQSALQPSRPSGQWVNILWVTYAWLEIYPQEILKVKR